ncbi:MAG: hypothetical protein JWR59_1581 [Brevundimonas sp.]|nr:hypothetical protein [Brevundimonas sp.]
MIRPVDDGTPRRSDTSRRRRVLAIALSLGAHLVLLPLAFLSQSHPPDFSPSTEEIAPIVITLEPPPPPPAPEPAPEPDLAASGGSPAPSPEPPAPAPVATPDPKPRPAPPPAVHTRAARPAPPNVPTIVANPGPPAVTFVGVGDGELAGAAVAGSGQGTGAGIGTGSGQGSGNGPGSGGPCDMVKRIQDALRDDARIRRTAAEAQGTLGRNQALLMWNGDWLLSPGQEGKGLAGVRQAIAVEIAFSPPACRHQTMRGYAVISLGDAPGSPRIALGAAQWRWSDLAGGRR